MARAALKAGEPSPQEQAKWKHVEFIRRYRGDPVAFAEDILSVDLLPDQRAFLQALQGGKRRISVRAGWGGEVGGVCHCGGVVHDDPLSAEDGGDGAGGRAAL